MRVFARDGGGTSTTQFGRVTISGAATIAGMLNLSLVNSYDPAVGSTYPIITYASHTGTFDTINGSSIPNNKTLVPTYNATNLTLTTTAAPAAGGPLPIGQPTTALLPPSSPIPLADQPSETTTAETTTAETADTQGITATNTVLASLVGTSGPITDLGAPANQQLLDGDLLDTVFTNTDWLQELI